jgi:ligand-binding sensor domain-containing protein
MPKKRWSPAIAGLLLCAGGSVLAAQANTRFTVDVLGTAQGLPSSAVLAVTQTRDGYLWVGTLNGLARFDGAQFAVFDENNTPGLNSSQIIRLYESVGGHRERRHLPGQSGHGHQC